MFSGSPAPLSITGTRLPSQDRRLSRPSAKAAEICGSPRSAWAVRTFSRAAESVMPERQASHSEQLRKLHLA